jgi:hypothetical protein
LTLCTFSLHQRCAWNGSLFAEIIGGKANAFFGVERRGKYALILLPQKATYTKEIR